MAHVGKLLARLNPTTVRYDISRGGMPELTPQDIAGALAMVPAGLGRELICRLWWPGGAQLTSRDLDDLLRDAQLAEWRRRMDGMITAQLMSASAETPRQRSRAQQSLDDAKAKMWPRIGEGSSYAPIRQAVLTELSAACLCEVCRGHGHARRADGKFGDCVACEGSGRRKVSDRSRAALIKSDPAAFRRYWSPVYQWTLDYCNSALGPAHRKLKEIVS